jgi:hypothetical protein
MPLRRALTVMALGFLALTLVMGCASDTSVRGQQAREMKNWTDWYVTQPGLRNAFMDKWLLIYFADYLDYYMSLDFHPSRPYPRPHESPSSGSSAPVVFNTSGPQSTVDTLKGPESTIPPTLMPTVQTAPPPPPPAPTPAPQPSPPQYSVGQ